MKITTNQREVLAATDSGTSLASYITATNHKLDVNATASLAGSSIPIAGATTAVGVAIVDGSGNQITSFGGGTQYADGAVRGTATGTIAMVDDGVNIQSLSGDSTGKLNVNNISGTITLPTGASTAVKQPALGTAGSASADVITVQGIASMTKLLVTPDSVALPANQSVNVSQINGVTPLMGVGATGTGAARVVLANDQGKTLVSKGGSSASSGDNTLVTAGTNKLKVYAFSLSTTSTTSVTCIFQSGASGTELWRVVLQAGTGTSTGANLVVQPPAWLFATASATLLNLNLSAAQTVHWSLSYFDEA